MISSQNLSLHRCLFLFSALPGSSTAVLRVQKGLGLPRKQVQQETFLEFPEKERPMQRIQAGLHLKPRGNLANRSHPEIQRSLVAGGVTVLLVEL